jgi:hypothetical protein
MMLMSSLEMTMMTHTIVRRMSLSESDHETNSLLSMIFVPEMLLELMIVVLVMLIVVVVIVVFVYRGRSVTWRKQSLSAFFLV